MKRHGHYELPTPDELLLDMQCDGCSQEYISKQMRRHRQKHANNKRHQQKHKTAK